MILEIQQSQTSDVNTLEIVKFSESIADMINMTDNPETADKDKSADVPSSAASNPSINSGNLVLPFYRVTILCICKDKITDAVLLHSRNPTEQG